MGSLAVRTLRLAARPPFPWARDAVDEAAGWIRRSLIPLAIAHGVYLTGFGIILFGHVFGAIGVVDREPGAIALFWDREIATWVTGMIFAGLVGSAITADLGARRVREELDALSVLGIDSVRALVVPRVMAAAFVAPVLAALSLLWVILVNLVVGTHELGLPTGVFLADLGRTIFPLDMFFTMFLKNLVIGGLVGVVACHKGLTCSLGPEGVGRAVNQAIVIAFCGIWLFDTCFNLAYLSLFPQASILHG
jgi:phospholipid/cholesterol/gamma-HCH transport system permease protein